jgi:uncharacterized membrane-anchored protein YitT (DUF2179 family)
MKNASHSVFEDVFALLCAGLFVAFGIFLFQSQELMVGGAAGLALLSTYVFPVEFGLLFFLINLPFYYLAWRQISKRFMVNTFISVTTVSLFSEWVPQFVDLSRIDPIFAAVFGGILIGVGMLIMFRHSSSLGGLGILAFYLQSRFNIRAGTFQLCVDTVILSISFLFIDAYLVLISILAALCLNMVISLNHRPERYSLPQSAKPVESSTDIDTNADDVDHLHPQNG